MAISSTSKNTLRDSIPAGWLSLGLITWGSLTGHVISALLLAVLLEFLNYSRTRWLISRRDFYRITDFTSVLFVTVSAIQFSRYSLYAIYHIIAVAPYCFFPLVLAQLASSRGRMPISCFHYSRRKRREKDKSVDVRPPYLMACVLAASTSQDSPILFFLSTTLIVVGLLYMRKNKRYPFKIWVVSFLLASIIGLAIATGAKAVRQPLLENFVQLVSQLGWSPEDPNKAYTAIGSIGKLKISNNIRIRVRGLAQEETPIFLREATFDTFHSGTWTADDSKFSPIDKTLESDQWQTISKRTLPTKRLEIVLDQHRERSLIPVPGGTTAVESTEVAEIQINRFGTLLAESAPGTVKYRPYYTPATIINDSPKEADLFVAPPYRQLIEDILEEIGLNPSDEEEQAVKIRDYFKKNFYYSLAGQSKLGSYVSLLHFLDQSKTGHCEYFATATTLLLRSAGIPARYTVGYVVQDYSLLENAHIARDRDAHSWATAFINGKWVIIDSTPSSWHVLENAATSQLQIIQDVLDWALFSFRRFMLTDFHELVAKLSWLVPLLFAVLYFRLRKKETISIKKPQAEVSSEEYHPLSELLAILAGAGLHPNQSDTMATFLNRAAPPAAGGVAIGKIIEHYYREKFAPKFAHSSTNDILEAELRTYCDDLNNGYKLQELLEKPTSL